MTNEELKKKLQSVCEPKLTIVDVRFYVFNGEKLIVVVRGKTFSSGKVFGIYSQYYDSIEKAILDYIDPNSLTAMEMSENVGSSSAEIESF